MKILVSLCFLPCILGTGHYLFYYPFSSQSVAMAALPMIKELANRGHKVTVICPHKGKPINGVRNIIHSSQLERAVEEVSATMLSNEESGFSDIPIGTLIDVTIENNRLALRNTEVQELLEGEEKVDVVVTIPVMGNEAGYYLAHKKNSSLVMFASVGYILPWMAEAVGNPINPSYMPLPFGYSQRMSFLERMVNYMGTLGIYLGRRFYILPKIRSMLESEFPGEDIPDLNTLAKKTALLINHGSPFTGDGMRPTMPKTIMASLMSCSPPNPLEQTLLNWIEGAEHGVVYMSFGSILKPSKMSESRRDAIVKVLGSLKQRVIWKWDATMAEVPKNIFLSSWLPQTDILAHPNVKLFITHGGAGSVQETICHKTPILGIPVMGDQVANIEAAITQNIGTAIRWADFSEEKFSAAIQQVLNNPTYRESIESLSDLILDQPLHPLNNSIWWLEYLLRHPHNTGMAHPGDELSWVQFYLLDVAVFVLLSLTALLTILRLAFKICCCRKKEKKD